MKEYPFAKIQPKKKAHRQVFQPFQWCLRNIQEMGMTVKESPEYEALSDESKKMIDLLVLSAMPWAEAEPINHEDENEILIEVVTP